MACEVELDELATLLIEKNADVNATNNDVSASSNDNNTKGHQLGTVRFVAERQHCYLSLPVTSRSRF
eukprot:1490552-Rhodomonas_salina.2